MIARIKLFLKVLFYRLDSWFMDFLGYRLIGFPWALFVNSKILLGTGFLGSGKTLGCVAVSHHLWLNGYVAGVTANIPLAWSVPIDFFDPDIPARYSWCILFDELGKLVDNRSYRDKDVTEAATKLVVNARKKDQYVLSPSIIPLDNRLRMQAIRFTLFKPFPFFWLYLWERGEEDPNLRTPAKYQSGYFLLFNPRFFYRSYDTYDIPQGNRNRAFLELVISGIS